MILDRNIETETRQQPKWKMPDAEHWWWGTVLTFAALLVLAVILFLIWATFAILGWRTLIVLAGVGVISGIGWIVGMVFTNLEDD